MGLAAWAPFFDLLDQLGIGGSAAFFLGCGGLAWAIAEVIEGLDDDGDDGSLFG